jgi:cellulose biosynthesis protein BcsQ
MTFTTAAVVGATGGAGTTRTTLEAAALLAADGTDVAVLDAAYATQGLGGYLDGRLEPDATALVTDRSDAPLSAGLVDLGVDLTHDHTGRVVCCPVDAPFERLARAKSVEAAKRFEARIEEAAATFDHVLVDVPPIAANQAIAATTACERVAVVAPASDRGADAAGRLRERVADLGSTVDVVAMTRGADDHERGDMVVPATSAPFPAVVGDEQYERAVAALVSRLLERDVENVGESAGLFGRIRRR